MRLLARCILVHLGAFWIHLDAFRCISMHLDAFRCISLNFLHFAQVLIAGGILMSGEKNFLATPLPARFRSLARLPNFHNL